MLVSKEQLFFVQHSFLPISHFGILQNRKCWNSNRKPFLDFIISIQTPWRCCFSSREAQNSHSKTSMHGQVKEIKVMLLCRQVQIPPPEAQSSQNPDSAVATSHVRPSHSRGCDFFPSIPHPPLAAPRPKHCLSSKKKPEPSLCTVNTCPAVPAPRRWERTDRGQAQHSLGKNRKG